MKNKREKTNWQKTRKLFNDIHLWVGLISGIFVIAICLSGTIYVYNDEFRQMAAPHLHKVAVPENAPRIAPDAIVNKVADIVQGDINGISIPFEKDRTYRLNVKAKDDKSRFGTAYFINPYTAEITGTSHEKTGTDEFMGYMFSLHRWLLLDKLEQPIFDDLPNRTLGSYISGFVTILFTLGVITGIVIWFPQKLKSWQQGLKLKLNGNWKRANHDLHNTLAFYSLIFLLLMGLTGPQWSFPWYRTGLQKVLGTYEERGGGGDGRGRNTGPDSDQAKAGLPLSLNDYLAAADQSLSYDGDYFINLNISDGKPVEIAKSRVGFFAPAAGDKISLDPKTAAVLEMDIFRDKPFNQRVARSIKALHVGDVYGSFSKLLYFLACLIATSLPVTGTIIWLNKLKKKKKMKKSSSKSNIQVSSRPRIKEEENYQG